MDVKNYFKENKKKLLKIIFLSSFFLTTLFFTIAYISGKNVSEEIAIQWVSHTEYWRDDSASTIVRLADYKGQPITVDSCTVKILYPDKSVFVSAGEMTQSNVDGNWYRTDSLVGSPLGTYEQEVTCRKGSQVIISSQSFHLNPALEEISTLSNKANLLNESLFNFDIELAGIIRETGESLTTKISVSETNLNNALTSAHQSIINNLESTGISLNSNLNNINATIVSKIEGLDSKLTSNLNAINTSLTSFLSSLQSDLSTQLTTMLSDLTNQLTNIKEDTTWIVSNAVNQQDMGEIVQRFDSLGSDLSKVLVYCSDSVTDASKLCQEIYGLRDTVALLRQEQDTRFDQLDQVTANTWELLSGSVSNRIDSILISLNVIQDQNREINSTTHEVLDEIQGKINVDIIS